MTNEAAWAGPQSWSQPVMVVALREPLGDQGLRPSSSLDAVADVGSLEHAEAARPRRVPNRVSGTRHVHAPGMPSPIGLQALRHDTRPM